MENNKNILAALEITNNIIKPYLCNSFNNSNGAFVRDSYDIDNNLVIKRIGRNILTGTENFRYDFETNTFAYYQENKFNLHGLGKFDTMMSNYFRWQPFNTNIKESWFQGNDKGEIMFKFSNNIEDINTFKSWLKEKYLEGKPVEVFFVLQSPIIVKKEKIYNWCYLNKSAREFKDITFSSPNGGLSPLVEIKYRTFNRKQ